MEILLHLFLSSRLRWGSGWPTPLRNPITHFTGSCVGPDGACPLWRRLKYLALPRNRTQYHPANSLVTKPTELFRPPCTLTYISVTGDIERASASKTAPSLAREANGSPEPGSCHIFYLSSSWDSPRPPHSPLSIDGIVPHFLQLLHFLFSFVSSFPHFKKWKTLSFRNKERSCLGLEGQFFRTWQLPVRLVPSETRSSAPRIRLSCEKSFFASIWVRNKLMNFCLVANWLFF